MRIYVFNQILLFSLLMGTAWAEPNEQDSAEPEVSLQQQSQQLIEKIQQATQQSKTLKKQFAQQPTLEKLMFMNLVITLEREARKEIGELINIQQQMAPDSTEAENLTQQLQALTTRQSGIIQVEIGQLRKILTNLKEMNQKDKSTQFVVQRAKLEIYGLLADWLENIQRQKSLGMDVATSEKKLTKLVQIIAIAQTSKIRIYLDTIKQLNQRIEDADEPEQKEINTILQKLEWRKDIEAENLEKMVSILNSLKVDTTKFGQALVLATGEILNENVETRAVIGLFQQMINKAMYWLHDNMPLIIFRIISFVLIIFAFRIIAGLARHLVNKATASSKIDSSQLLHNFLGSITHKIIMLIGLIIALSQLGIEIGPLLAGMGIMGFVVGFALQDALSNFASGLMILIYRPFDIGDFVDVAGINGEVKEMNLVSTTILTVDRKRMIIPNTKIWGNIITNVTAEDVRRIDFVFRVGYKDDLEAAEDVLRTVVQNHHLVLPDPPITIKLHTLAESSVEFIARPWVKRQNYWEVYWDITRQVKEAFDQAGITMPYPQRVIHSVIDDSKSGGTA